MPNMRIPTREMPPKSRELEKLRRELRNPMLLIEVVEPERAPESHLLIIVKGIITEKTIYFWLTT